MKEQKKYFVGKIWQSKNYKLCFQLKASGEKEKIFLVVDTSSRKTPLFFSDEKVSSLLPNGNIASLLRKHLESSLITEIFEEKETLYWISFCRRGHELPSFYLKINLEKSPLEASFVSSEKKTLFRYGKGGTFTHVKNYENPLPHEEKENFFSSYLEKLLISFQKKKDLKNSEETEEKTPEEEGLPNKELRKALKKRFKTLKKSLEKLEKNFFTKEDLEKEKQELGFLQSYLYQAETGDETLTLKSSLTGLAEDLSFPRDPKLSNGKNLSRLFEKLAKKEKGYDYNLKNKEELKKTLKALENDLEDLEKRPLSEEEQEKLEKKYHLKKQSPSSAKNKSVESSPYKLFVDQNNVSYYVGKSSRDNDTLVKKARSNDLWFHASGTQGSHVIVPRSSLKKKANLEEVKRFGAILALYYSKSKNDRRGEVYASSRQHLKKSKQAAPGLWTVMKSETLFISYEEEELKNVLNQMKN